MCRLLARAGEGGRVEGAPVRGLGSLGRSPRENRVLFTSKGPSMDCSLIQLTYLPPFTSCFVRIQEGGGAFWEESLRRGQREPASGDVLARYSRWRGREPHSAGALVQEPAGMGRRPGKAAQGGSAPLGKVLEEAGHPKEMETSG